MFISSSYVRAKILFLPIMYVKTISFITILIVVITTSSSASSSSFSSSSSSSTPEGGGDAQHSLPLR
jgi:hypothetical protein